LLNACEAVSGDTGHVRVELREIPNAVEVRVTDNGHGIPESIRDRLFEPFVSYGKENGTGLGLTVVHKIVQDHGGDVVVEETSETGTVFRIVLPLASSAEGVREIRGDGKPAPPRLTPSRKAQSE
jgi:signal transduction histidine kinase